jgi:hypothetical protein
METQTLNEALNVVRIEQPKIFTLVKSAWGSKELHSWLAKSLIDPAELELKLSTNAAMALMTISLAHAEEFKFEMVGEVVRKRF